MISDQFQSYIRSVTETIHFLRSREWILLICFVAFLSASGMGLSNPILSLYVRGYGVSTALVGFFITMFAVGRIFVTIPAGQAADRWGRKAPMVIGALITAVSSLGLALAPSYPHLIVARFFQGVGSALYMSAAFLVVADLSLPEERGRTTSFFQGSTLLGLTIAPSIGGWLASASGIAAPILGNALLELLVGILILWRFPGSLGKTNLSKRKKRSSHSDSSPSASIRSLAASRNFILITLAAFLIFVGRAGSRDTLMPLIGDTELGLDTIALGFIFTLIALCNLLMIPVAGIISDTRGRKYALFIGLALNGLALIAIGTSSTINWFIIGAMFMGIGKGFGEPSSIIYMTDISPSGRYGAAFGLFFTLRDAGLFIGPVFLSWVADFAGLRFPFILNGIGLIMAAFLVALAATETLRPLPAD